MAMTSTRVNIIDPNEKPKFSIVDLLIYLMCEMEIEKDAKKKYKCNDN